MKLLKYLGMYKKSKYAVTIKSGWLFGLILIFVVSACGSGGSEAAKVDVSERPFITTWKTDGPGPSNDNQIKIGTRPPPIRGVSGYDFRIDWGDGSIDSNVTESITHTYASEGTYTISITGKFPWMYFGENISENRESDSNKLLSVEQWGDIKWASMRYAFYRCSYLVINASDKPDLSLATSLYRMFYRASSVVDGVGHWDVSTISDMNGVFTYALNFNEDISAWDVSSVTSTGSMFRRARSFNQDLSQWDLSSVAYMNLMFYGASSFNQNISSWDLSTAYSMAYMFGFATNFNQDISSWDVSGVEVMDHMFEYAVSFDQDLSAWNVTTVTNMTSMFGGSKLSTANYDALLLGWGAQNLRQNVVFDGGNSQYSESNKGARDTLTEAYNWIVTDGGVQD